jgi:aromatase
VTSEAAPADSTTEHSIVVGAPPAVVFALIADVGSWPHIFAPTVHAEVIEEHDGEQRLRIWAFAGEKVFGWQSRRTLDEARGLVAFRQEVTSPPVKAMSGEWHVEPVDDGTTRVRLLHDYRAEYDDPEALDFIAEAVDRNSKAELLALRNAAELHGESGEVRFAFSDTVDIDGPAAEVYDFLNRADLWPERLPHVVHTELTEEPPGIQYLAMDTRLPDETVHNTRSVRVCFPERGEIAYKQMHMPVTLRCHSGRWVIEQTPQGTRATSWHSVTVDPEGVRSTLGADVALSTARAKIRQALGGNSTKTLLLAKAHVEGGTSR